MLRRWLLQSIILSFCKDWKDCFQREAIFLDKLHKMNRIFKSSPVMLLSVCATNGRLATSYTCCVQNELTAKPTNQAREQTK